MAKKTKNSAALALSKMSSRKRMRTMTAKQRSEQARKAVNTRWNRKGPWYVLLVYPETYLQKGVVNAVAEMIAHPRIEFFSQDKAEVVAKSQSPQYRDRVTDIAEQGWDPGAFTIRRNFSPDVNACKQWLQVDGGDS